MNPLVNTKVFRTPRQPGKPAVVRDLTAAAYEYLVESLQDASKKARNTNDALILGALLQTVYDNRPALDCNVRPLRPKAPDRGGPGDV